MSYPNISHRKDEISCFQNKIHKPLYYMKCLYPNKGWIPAWKSVLQDGIKQMCQDYLSAYLWTVSYYFDECLGNGIIHIFMLH